MKNKNGLSNARFWILVWGLGIAGQICWNMENQWFNTFVYAKIAKDPTIISWMAAFPQRQRLSQLSYSAASQTG